MKKFVLSVLLPLLIPIICFLFVWNIGGDGHVKLPKYYVLDSTKNIITNGKTKEKKYYHFTQDLKFVNQLGDSISINNTFKNKIVVFNIFNIYDSANGLQLNKNMKFLQKVYKKKDDSIAFISIANNTPTVNITTIRNYANYLGANHDKWNFAIVPHLQLTQYIYNEIKIPNFDTTYKIACNEFVLLDKDRNIRGYYNALDTFEIRNCADDISLLMLEKKRN